MSAILYMMYAVALCCTYSLCRVLIATAERDGLVTYVACGYPYIDSCSVFASTVVRIRLAVFLAKAHFTICTFEWQKVQLST